MLLTQKLHEHLLILLLKYPQTTRYVYRSDQKKALITKVPRTNGHLGIESPIFHLITEPFIVLAENCKETLGKDPKIKVTRRLSTTQTKDKEGSKKGESKQVSKQHSFYRIRLFIRQNRGEANP